MTTSSVRSTQAISKYPKYTIACLGDSLTLATGNSLRASDYWPSILQYLLQQQGALVKCRNLGISGETTQQMWLRVGCMTQYEVPDLAIIWGGTNDPGASIAQGTTVTPGGTAYAPSPSNNTPSYLAAILQALTNRGVKRMLIVNNHYLDYSSGGDSTANAFGASQYASIIASQRAAQAFVPSNTFGGAAPSIQLVDVYTFVVNMFLAASPGTPPALNVVSGNQMTVAFPQYALASSTLDGSTRPQVLAPTTYTLTANADSSPIAMATGGRGFGIQLAATANVHYNELGNVAVANAVYAVITAQTGWIGAWQT